MTLHSFQFDYCAAYSDTFETGDQARDYFTVGASEDFDSWVATTRLLASFYAMDLEYFYQNMDAMKCLAGKNGTNQTNI